MWKFLYGWTILKFHFTENQALLVHMTILSPEQQITQTVNQVPTAPNSTYPDTSGQQNG